ncbi:MAG: hypothetical protein HS111_07735 [Kofleriaceae bacterium]|nr:hypothetical protein [Kofleriaceae bacterium]
MAKDRARPFSRKHARYWMTAAGGMVVIMVVNVVLGFWLYGSGDGPARTPAYLPVPPHGDAAVEAPPADAGVEAPRADAGGGP